MPLYNPPGVGSGGMVIGAPVTGAALNRPLFVDSGGNLAQSALFNFFAGSGLLTVGALTSDGQVLGANTGTAGPAIPDFASGVDPDTGMYMAGGNVLGFATAGVQRLTISSGVITMQDDVPVVATFGRAKLSEITGADTMALSHRDMIASAGYAIFQTAAGATGVNSNTGQNLSFGIGASTRWQLASASPFAFRPAADNANDLGETALRVRRFHLGEYIEVSEMTAPAAPGANKARWFSQDNGAGKTQLMVIFPTGAAQQIAIEP